MDWLNLRPDILSSGSIGFAAGGLLFIVSLLLFLTSLRSGPEREGFAFGPIDGFYAAAAAVLLASFILAAGSPGGRLQPLMMVGAFAVYLFVRTNRPRLAGGRAAALTGGLVAVAGLEALHGLAQWSAGREMRGLFFNVNHLAMFLALMVPPGIALARFAGTARLRAAGYAACGSMVAAVALSRCRTAYTALLTVLGLALVLAKESRLAEGSEPGPRRKAPALRAGLALGATAIILAVAFGLSFKPRSAAGRMLIWKVSAGMALAHPLSGIGYGNFALLYSPEQGRYFEAGGGTPLERFSAMPAPYAFNDYLEAAVETGLAGLVVLLPFWGLALKKSAAAFRGFGRFRATGRAPSPDERLTAGAGGSVLVFMIMALFYYPSRILPVLLPFSAMLGWLAGESRPASPAVRRAGRTFVLAFSAASLAVTAFLLPGLYREFRSERVWSTAAGYARSGRPEEAVSTARTAYPALRSNPDFIGFYAGLLLAGGQAREAASALEGVRKVSSSPFVAEKLAAARLELGDLKAALTTAREADAVLPWRLTSKALLAEIASKLGDGASAARYARLVIDTPMKTRTTEGETLKAKALVLLAELPAGSDGRENPLVELMTTLPEECRGGVLGALQAMGSRSEPFIAALRAAAPDDKADLAFLLANMPDRDIREIDAGLLMENIEAARLARRTIPPARAVPDEIFRDYVLPYAAADETRESWRPGFFRMFREAAATSPSIDEAVLRLNRDVFLAFRLGFDERNMRKPLIAPRRAIELGFVSCGEASLLLVYACRAVGIPARLAVLPHWPRQKAGHMWIEFWDGTGWRHLPAYDPGLFEMDWIGPQIAASFPAHSRGVVFAPAFRRTGPRPLAGRDIVFTDISENYLK